MSEQAETRSLEADGVVCVRHWVSRGRDEAAVLVATADGHVQLCLVRERYAPRDGSPPRLVMALTAEEADHVASLLAANAAQLRANGGDADVS